MNEPVCVNPNCGNIITKDKKRGNYSQRHGWCEACYSRWRRRGRPQGVWPFAPERIYAKPGWSDAAQVASKESQQRRVNAQFEDALWILNTGESLEQAAKRTGMSEETLRRYLAS